MLVALRSQAIDSDNSPLLAYDQPWSQPARKISLTRPTGSSPPGPSSICLKELKLPPKTRPAGRVYVKVTVSPTTERLEMLPGCEGMLLISVTKGSPSNR